MVWSSIPTRRAGSSSDALPNKTGNEEGKASRKRSTSRLHAHLREEWIRAIHGAVYHDPQVHTSRHEDRKVKRKRQREQQPTNVELNWHREIKPVILHESSPAGTRSSSVHRTRWLNDNLRYRHYTHPPCSRVNALCKNVLLQRVAAVMRRRLRCSAQGLLSFPTSGQLQ